MKSWPLKVFILSFILAAIFSGLSSFCADMNVTILILILVIVILIGIIFDMVGVAVLTSKEVTFHAMSSKKIAGAKESISLLRNSNIVSSICNDVIGDICGIVSGSLGAALTSYIVLKLNGNILWITLLITSLISALTVGGKALGKTIAMKKSDNIVFFAGKIKNIFHIK